MEKKINIEDVKDYFKNAKRIKNRFNKEFEYKGVSNGLWGSFINKGTGFTIYDEQGGFAEIIETK